MSDQTPAVQHAMQLPARVTPTHIFFFGNETGSVYDPLSQWYACSPPFRDPSLPVLDDDKDDDNDDNNNNNNNHHDDNDDHQQVSFRTTEHYMMYRKAALMGDWASAARIRRAGTPHEAKVLGRGIRPYDGRVWAESCDAVVERGNWCKFSADPALAALLLGTADRVLVEGNPADRIWGVGFDNDTAQGREPEWGANKLGKALMRVRDRLRRREEATGDPGPGPGAAVKVDGDEW